MAGSRQGVTHPPARPVQAHPRASRADLEHAGGVGDAELVEDDELEDRTQSGAEPVQLLMQSAPLPLGIDPLQRAIHGVRFHDASTTEPADRPAMTSSAPMLHRHDMSRNAEDPRSRRPQRGAVATGRLDHRDKDVRGEVGSGVRVIDPTTASK